MITMNILIILFCWLEIYSCIQLHFFYIHILIRLFVIFPSIHDHWQNTNVYPKELFESTISKIPRIRTLILFYNTLHVEFYRERREKTSSSRRWSKIRCSTLNLIFSISSFSGAQGASIHMSLLIKSSTSSRILKSTSREL